MERTNCANTNRSIGKIRSLALGKVWESAFYYIPASKDWHKVGASSGECEVSEFSAYWIMQNRVRFIKKLTTLKKTTSFIILIYFPNN